MTFSADVFLWAFAGGFLPSLIWLWFWLKEDKRHPEPARLIFFAFAAGMGAVVIALFLEQFAQKYITGGILLIVAWATIEEVLKYLGAYVVALRTACVDRSRCLDEAIDPLIYLITVALGFAALENVLFLLAPVARGELLAGVVMGNLRFVGATVLHVAASGAVGVALGLSFYKTRFAKHIALAVGLCTAIALHTAFNISILLNKGGNLLGIFSVLWLAVLVILFLFERLKRLRKRSA